MSTIFHTMRMKALCFAGMIPIVTHDTVSPDSKTAQEMIMNDSRGGWDRLRMVFTIDEFDSLSPELTTVMQATVMGGFIGACYGGINSSRVAYLDFMAKNQATQFKSHLDAKKKLQDQFTIGFIRGAYRWGWRLALFTGSYMLVSASVSAYRGKTGILEHVVGGMVTGGIYKCSLGLRGMAVGTILGGTLGSICGLCTYSILKISGFSMEEVMYWRKNWRESRKKMVKEALSSSGGINEDPLVQDYIKRHNSTDLLPKNE